MQMFREVFAKKDMQDVARYKRNPTTQTFDDFLNDIKTIAKQADGDEPDKSIKMFFLG